MMLMGMDSPCEPAKLAGVARRDDYAVASSIRTPHHRMDNMNNMRTNNVVSNLVVLLVLAASGCAVAPDQPDNDDVVARVGPPRAGPNFQATATIVSPTEVRLNWDAVANATSFHVDRLEDIFCDDGTHVKGNCLAFADFPDLSAATRTFTDTTVQGSAQSGQEHGSYTWRLEACNTAGCSYLKYIHVNIP